MLWEDCTHRSSRFSLSRHTEIVFVVVTSSTVGCLEVMVAARVLLLPNGHCGKKRRATGEKGNIVHFPRTNELRCNASAKCDARVCEQNTCSLK